MMRLSTLALLLCCMLFACDDKEQATPHANPDAGTGDSAGEAGSDGEAGAGGEAGADGADGADGEAGAGGEAPQPDCVDFDIFEACDDDETVQECWSNVTECSESDSPLGTSCDSDSDCERGICVTDALCNEAQAGCVEDAGFPEAANCLRLFESCLAERGESAVGDCGALVNECMASLTACE